MPSIASQPWEMPMDTTLETRVRSVYPDFFVRRSGATVCDVPIATGDGWYPIFMSLFRALRELSDYSGARFMGLQIKQKFGRLRVWCINHHAPDFDTAQLGHLLVDTAEFISASTCEICGEPGSLIKVNYWCRTRCAKHVNGCELSAGDLQELVPRLIQAPEPVLDLSLLSPQGLIEQWPDGDGSKFHLSLTTYRSMPNYLGARLSDIECAQPIGWFNSDDEATAASEQYGCRTIVRVTGAYE